MYQRAITGTDKQQRQGGFVPKKISGLEFTICLTRV
jgi:hypothetical protein